MSNLFKLYRRGTDGTPTLFMPDQTTIGSSLGNVDLHADLASLASKEYVVDTIDNLNKSNLAGRVDTYGDLPNWQLLTPYVAPELSSPGEPMVDDYSVSVQHPLTELGESGDPHRATTVERTPNMSLIMHPIPNYFAMVFKQPLQATKLKLVNRTPSQYSYGYHLKNFSIEAKAPSGWVELYRGINTNQTGGAEFEFDIVNTEFYHEYRLNIIDVYPGSAGDYFYIDLIQLSGNVSSVAPDGEVGAIYLVGTEGNLEEYIFTEWGTWERIGEIRQSDVDLSGYTTTEGMDGAIANSSSMVDGYIESMRLTIQGAISELDADISLDMQNIKADAMMLEDKNSPTIWPDTLGDSKFLFAVEPKYVLLDFKDAMWDTDLVTSNLGAYTQVPLLTSDTSDPNIEVLHARTYYTNSAYRPWVVYSATVTTGWHSLNPVAGAYIGVHKKDTPFRFNQLTLIFSLGRQIFAGHEVLIQGSNDGVTWDTILDTIPQEVMTHKYGAAGTTSRSSSVNWIASLDKYYEYSYVRLVCNVWAASYLIVNLFLIQDTAIHGTVKKYLD